MSCYAHIPFWLGKSIMFLDDFKLQSILSEYRIIYHCPSAVVSKYLANSRQVCMRFRDRSDNIPSVVAVNNVFDIVS